MEALSRLLLCQACQESHTKGIEVPTGVAVRWPIWARIQIGDCSGYLLLERSTSLTWITPNDLEDHGWCIEAEHAKVIQRPSQPLTEFLESVLVALSDHSPIPVVDIYPAAWYPNSGSVSTALVWPCPHSLEGRSLVHICRHVRLSV